MDFVTHIYRLPTSTTQDCQRVNGLRSKVDGKSWVQGSPPSQEQDRGSHSHQDAVCPNKVLYRIEAVCTNMKRGQLECKGSKIISGKKSKTFCIFGKEKYAAFVINSNEIYGPKWISITCEM